MGVWPSQLKEDFKERFPAAVIALRHRNKGEDVDIESNAVKFLGVASQCLRTGQNQKALQIAGGLTKIDFSRRKHARLFEAIAQSRLGLTTAANANFKKLYADCEDDTVFKADVVREWAKLRLSLGELEGFSEKLELAYGIYTFHGLEERVGAIIYQQALFALRQGDLEEAVDKTRWGTAVSEIRLPDIAPFAPEVEIAHSEEVAALSRAEMAGVGS